jgi:hypothetical protein
MLLAHGADVTMREPLTAGPTPLGVARQLQHREIIRLLEAAGAKR